MKGEGRRMNFDIDDDIESVREGIRKVCAGFDDSYWRHCDAEHQFPWAFYEALADGGWIGVAIPEAYGGGGQGISCASVVLEERKRRYLQRVAAGDLQVAFGVTEPDAGTDTTAITTRATLDGDRYIVRGQKVWTTKAPLCEKVLLLVRTTPLEMCARRTDGL